MNRNHDPCPALETLERRSMVEFRALGDEANPYIVTGYAATFDPFVLYSFDGVDYKERILPDAFSMADMSDVIFQFDHHGRVYARTSNKTLEVTPDDHGLKIRADLSSTESAKAIFEEIRTGLITKMSFSFRVSVSLMVSSAASIPRRADGESPAPRISLIMPSANSGKPLLSVWPR